MATLSNSATQERKILTHSSSLIFFFSWGKINVIKVYSCGIPVTTQFISMNGGFVDKDWMVLSLSTLVYLGIGDTIVSRF